MSRKSTGFTGQRIIQLPGTALQECRKMPLVRELFISKMGFFPKALHHYYHRPKGLQEAILLWCTDGQGWIKMPDGKSTLKAGEIFIVPAGVPHSYGAVDRNPWTLQWFHLGGAQRNEVMEMVNLTSRTLPVGIGEERESVFHKIEETLLKGYSPQNLVFANLALHYLLASFVVPESFRVQAKAPVSYAEKAIAFMRDNIAKPVSLTKLADTVNLSVSFFSRTFKKETGYSPADYFSHLKIQRACQLLHDRTLRVNEVASRVGIDDPFYFSRIFKKQIGHSPLRYRDLEVESKN